MKLGKLPPKHDDRTLRLGILLDETMVPNAPSVVLPPSVEHWGLYGNDRLADCTCAAAAHMIIAWAADDPDVPDRTPAEDEVIGMYHSLTGGNDTGAFALDALNSWRVNGLGSDRIAAYVKVQHDIIDHVKRAIWMFGGLYTGFALPLTAEAQGSAQWEVIPSAGDAAAHGSWGGHAVNVVGYDVQGVTIVTWGRLQRMSWGFWQAYCDESYAVLDRIDWLGDVPGFNIQQLCDQLEIL